MTQVRDALVRRATLHVLIRNFFAQRGVLEVETPMLSSAGTTEPNIESLRTVFRGRGDAGPGERWLRTSAEHSLKRLLALGIGDCYELGRVFRNGEAGRQHNPEFSMLEWYRVGWDYLHLIDETVELVTTAIELSGGHVYLSSITYNELFKQSLGIDPFTESVEGLRGALGDRRIDATGLTRDDWLDLLVTHHIQSSFPADRITVVRDWPASQCALARIRHDDPPVAERFEVYVGPIELANGYHELTVASEQRARFENDNRRRRERGQPQPPIDEALLAALAAGIPDCSGVALGIDRLLMVLADSDDIRDVLAFGVADA